MEFIVLPTNSKHAPGEGQQAGYLWTDQWDDWFTYSTMYYFTYFDRAGEKHELGQVKIGQFDWQKKQRRPNIPERFPRLSDDFFSLGQDIDYYKGLMELAEDERITVLRALRDVAYDSDLYARALEEDVMRESLMRSSGPRKVEIQYRAVLGDGAELTPYEFSYRAPKTPKSLTDPVELEFEVTPGASPPTNIHVLIGRNGVGKTRLLNGMTRALVDLGTSPRRDGNFSFKETNFDLLGDDEETFANLVSVTFSAFDDFLSIYEAPNRKEAKIGYTNVGLRKSIGKGGQRRVITQNIARLSSDFAKSALICARGVRRRRWKRALETLETDSLFGEIEVANLADIDDEEDFDEKAKSLYKKLSSGHKIVLLTTTKLVELIEERSLVLMDEPEAHLHPPLLAAFVRALSDLLTNRNGVAIIATHSPVVVQEVPSSCVWKISRHGLSSKAERPEIETFAETVSVLTREVFGLEVDRSGFHKMLREIVAQEDTFESVMDRFDNEIGGQGQALIQAMLARRTRRGDD
ncbi:ATP-binding protein [Nitratireductor aquimarinus]|uniref:AAA family ATPase n=1 Tax=Nitratireductor TaxID=245876 RepID=UPI0019D3A04B|nr:MULTISPECIES: AAA family ATPase [Nitratireductor]MBN7776793.1 ATP-binding protein [Nitratireductor pacificus]MBN7780127.1 ATP-binding protein [Nitratireductor pacificus]MBN7788934.1 ATP-binding protein [Nitratireductor aquimarinus]MBY6099002.1 ATP-binding protein [Nitratireductor aquimarinus]MCA1259338.1 ATP-binding protein [Nitratireductor aquimarinus]